MIGQKKLLEKLNTYDLDKFPRSLLLLGEKGSGKHLICDYVKTNILKLPLLDITEDISSEFIKQIYLNPNPFIYLIDLNKMTEKESNILLKLIEEPISSSYLILISESKTGILNTILNRCVILEMDVYTKEELKEFTKGCANEDLILQVVRTPGKILSSDLDNLKDLYDLCSTIVSKVDVANYLNTLSISEKMNYKDEYSKFDVNLFFDVLSQVAYDKYLKYKLEKAKKIYLFTINERKKLADKRLNKELFMQNFLSGLWKEVRS